MAASPTSAPYSFARHDVAFASSGVTCRGWLAFPAAAAGQSVPLVIMGHGFGATREMRLEAYAERFHAAGMATLIFDYRRLGASDGEPRNLVVPNDEIADWHAALAYARSLPHVDTSRIALWGTSFGGGLVVSVAAQDGDVAAIVSQCPFMDGRAAALGIARDAGLGAALRLSGHALLDVLRATFGSAPHYMPIVARPGQVGVMTSVDSWDGVMRMAPPRFRNEVSARTALLVPLFRPLRDAAKVKCPALLQICELDTVAPTSATKKAAARMPRAEVLHYPVGHFDVYVGPAFEQSVNDQLAFLRRHLLPDRAP